MGGAGRRAAARAHSDKRSALLTPSRQQVPLPTRRGRHIHRVQGASHQRFARHSALLAGRHAAIHTGAPWRGGGRFVSGEPPMASSVRTPTSFEFAPEDQLEAQMPIEAILAKCKRWHARFRRRLRRESSTTAPLHETWGRWLPQDRISIDQVPCNLREGDGRTYAEVGSKRVWLVGCKQDDGKRFCTLQVAARCSNGSPDVPRRGQPRLSIIFRGTGKRISPEERAAWHPDVWVRFQKKAWADEAMCEDYALVEMAEITAAARLAGRESVAIFDNLHGQTTQTHLWYIWLVTGASDICCQAT